MNFKLIILVLASFSSLSQSAFAGKYLSPDQINESIAFLPPPPVEGSEVYKNDFLKLHEITSSTTPEECESANKEAPLLMPVPFLAPAGPLSLGELENWKAFAGAVYFEVKPVLRGLKSHFARPRPYVTDSSIKTCVDKEEGTNAYPSAHATFGELYARIFAAAYSDRAYGFILRGRQYGDHRVLGGVHHPSDVLAGQNLADHVFGQLMESPDFRADMEAAKAGTFAASATP